MDVRLYNNELAFARLYISWCQEGAYLQKRLRTEDDWLAQIEIRKLIKVHNQLWYDWNLSGANRTLVQQELVRQNQVKVPRYRRKKYCRKG